MQNNEIKLIISDLKKILSHQNNVTEKINLLLLRAQLLLGDSDLENPCNIFSEYYKRANCSEEEVLRIREELNKAESEKEQEVLRAREDEYRQAVKREAALLEL